MIKNMKNVFQLNNIKYNYLEIIKKRKNFIKILIKKYVHQRDV